MRMLQGVIILTAAAHLAAAAQAGQEFRVDPASTSVVIQVGRGGLLSFAGHNHEVAAPAVEGRITLNSVDLSRSRVALQFDAKALKVTGRGEPAGDVAEVQRTMLSDRVLDVARYPTITFESDQISVQTRSADGLSVVLGLRVVGRLTLHGVTKSLSIPVAVRLDGNRMTASGQATLLQSEFGIRPITAAGGTVRVKDEVGVTFRVVAVAAA